MFIYMKEILKNNFLLIVISVLISAFFLVSISNAPVSYNDLSRLAGIVSIARYGELEINKVEPLNSTGDRIEYKGNKYSSKPPVLHVATGYFVKNFFKIKPVLLNNDIAIYRFSTAIVVVLPLMILFISFSLFLQKSLKYSPNKSIIWGLILIFGTLTFTYSRHLNNHILETLIQFLLFILLYIEFSKKYLSLKYLLIGLLLSGLFVIDETYGFVAVPITLGYLLVTKRSEVLNIKNIFYFVIGCFPFLFAHFYLNFIQFETFLPPQLKPEVYLDYPGSKWVGIPQGAEAQNHPYLVRFFNYTFGTYGLFLYQPFLLLPFFIKKNWKDKLWLYTVFLTVSYSLFNTIMQPNYGGSSFGPRRFLPLIPILFFYSVKGFNLYWNKGYWSKVIVGLALCLTIIISLIGYSNPWGNGDILGGVESKRSLYFPLIYTIQNH